MTGALVMSVVGCASTPAPQDLLDARSAYLRAQSGPAIAVQARSGPRSQGSARQGRAVLRGRPRRTRKPRTWPTSLSERPSSPRPMPQTPRPSRVKGQAENDVKQTTKGQLAQARGQLAQRGATRLDLAGTRRKPAAARNGKEGARRRRQESEGCHGSAHRVDRRGQAGSREEWSSRSRVASSSRSNKDALLPGAQERLGHVAEALKTQDDHKIVVEGHTDSQGSAASNQGLSERRAQSVVSFLVSRGVPADQIRARGARRPRGRSPTTDPPRGEPTTAASRSS